MKYSIMQFYASDWLVDSQVGLCSPQTRGIWIDWICHMHLLDRCGQITGTRDELAVLGRCTVVHVESTLADLDYHKTANIEINGDLVTVINRRMRREFIANQRPALRSWINHRREMLIDYLSKKQAPECAFCGVEDDLQIDHIIPIAKGGNNALKNLQLLCGKCNRRKGAKYAQ